GIRISRKGRVQGIGNRTQCVRHQKFAISSASARALSLDTVSLFLVPRSYSLLPASSLFPAVSCFVLLRLPLQRQLNQLRDQLLVAEPRRLPQLRVHADAR